MSFDDYANHIKQKYKLAITIAVLRTKPEHLNIEQHIDILKESFDSKNNMADSNMSVISQDFGLNDDDFADDHLVEDDDHITSPTILKDFNINDFDTENHCGLDDVWPIQNGGTEDAVMEIYTNQEATQSTRAESLLDQTTQSLNNTQTLWSQEIFYPNLDSFKTTQDLPSTTNGSQTTINPSTDTFQVTQDVLNVGTQNKVSQKTVDSQETEIYTLKDPYTQDKNYILSSQNTDRRFLDLQKYIHGVKVGKTTDKTKIIVINDDRNGQTYENNTNDKSKDKENKINTNTITDIMTMIKEPCKSEVTYDVNKHNSNPNNINTNSIKSNKTNNELEKKVHENIHKYNYLDKTTDLIIAKRNTQTKLNISDTLNDTLSNVSKTKTNTQKEIGQNSSPKISEEAHPIQLVKQPNILKKNLIERVQKRLETTAAKSSENIIKVIDMETICEESSKSKGIKRNIITRDTLDASKKTKSLLLENSVENEINNSISYKDNDIDEENIAKANRIDSIIDYKTMLSGNFKENFTQIEHSYETKPNKINNNGPIIDLTQEDNDDKTVNNNILENDYNDLDTNYNEFDTEYHVNETTLNESSEINEEEFGVPFKIIEELNRIKSQFNRKNARKIVDDFSTDSGYRSESQARMGLSLSGNLLNQSAHALFSYLLNCPVNNSTLDIINEISKVLGDFIDKLHSEENYPPFLDEILEQTESLLQELLKDGFDEDDSIKKEEIIHRLLLLNKSVHIKKFTIEKITGILESVHKRIKNETELYEITHLRETENLCYIFHLMEAILKRYSFKLQMAASQSSSQLSEEENRITKSSLTQMWKKKWDKNYKIKDCLEINSNQSDLFDRVNDILNKIVVDCIDGYSLVSFAALQCFNLIQE